MSSSALYKNKEILAPMVRVGTLPMRLLALQFGADLVYSPEIVDKSIVASIRTFNESNGLVTYINPQSKLACFQTHITEKPKLIFQIGTADPELALQAALTVKQDVAGIDVNCGCPKKFSIQGGMGAALLSNPDLLKQILTNLVQKSGLPVSCKIRILETKEKTIELCKMIESTGVKAIAVHCRLRDERPRHPGHWDIFRDLVESISIPIIANGDIFTRADITRLKEISSNSVMFARGAKNNVSVFCKNGELLPLRKVVILYIKKAIEYNNLFSNTKYTIMQMYADIAKDSEYDRVTKAKSYETLCKIFGIELDQQHSNTMNPICDDVNFED
ncbi:1594_t:CDS:10 [Ambispora leptoticha]|uniref:tRNA-dihydrouridine synthase n=1 Tax=Ambispora leptoticha TaxID=144679 RepID=A0A9N9FZC6_9GLOM|nr:1594_t:CDS:10 [Ambispora leptoticha]